MNIPIRVKQIQLIIVLNILLAYHISTAPTALIDRQQDSGKKLSTSEMKQSSRTPKALPGLYEILSHADYNEALLDPDYLSPSLEDTENEVLSRDSYSNRRHNSPIYYIRLPPAPYMYVSGVGYVSHPPSVSPLGPTTNSFINLPINFVSNGKPSNIYQWSDSFEPPQLFPPHHPPQPALPAPPPVFHPVTSKPVFPVTSKPLLPTVTAKPTVAPTSKPVMTDSPINKLPGHYQFNGKPTDIFILRQSYNSLYSDALQNFYP